MLPAYLWPGWLVGAVVLDMPGGRFVPGWTGVVCEPM
jgi:hypothetical protein